MAKSGSDKHKAMYGYDHRKRRDGWAEKVRRGDVACARCGRWIHPLEKWDLGHDDSDPAHRRYSGPEHLTCNRATAGRGRPAPEPPPAWQPQRAGRRNVGNAAKFGWSSRGSIL